MTLSPRPDNSHDKSPNRRALTYGCGATSVAIGTIIAAGGKSGVDNGTIRLAIVVFGFLATLSFVVGLIAAWRDGSRGAGGKVDPGPETDS